MTSTDPVSTRNKILDHAERVYAASGMTHLTVRALTDDAGVNLAAVNYHFRSKASLIEAMLMRRIRPVWDERLALFARVKAAYGTHIQPVHLFCVTLLPWLRMVALADSAHVMAFFLRATSDTDSMIRSLLAGAFDDKGRLFDDAFLAAMPGMEPGEALWRVRLFFNAQPGSIVNHNIGVMCSGLFDRSDMTIQDALAHFAYLAESVFSGSANAFHVRYLVDNLWMIVTDAQQIAT